MTISVDDAVKLCFDASVEIMPLPAAVQEAVEWARYRSVDGYDRLVYVDHRARVYVRNYLEDAPRRSKCLGRWVGGARVDWH